MTCSNELNGVRYDAATGRIVVRVDGVDVDFANALSSINSFWPGGKLPGFSWSWETFDNGCQCTSCNAIHDAYAERSAATRYLDYSRMRISALRQIGWNGDSSMVKMAEGWLKTPRHVYQEYPMGLVCCRCNSRNEYAGAEHLKEGKYVCYNCK